MHALRHYGSVAYCYARLSIQRQLEYPMFLVSWILMIPIAYFSGLWILTRAPGLLHHDMGHRPHGHSRNL